MVEKVLLYIENIGKMWYKNNEDHIEDYENTFFKGESTYKHDYKPFKIVILDPDTMEPVNNEPIIENDDVNIVYFVPSPRNKPIKKHSKYYQYNDRTDDDNERIPVRDYINYSPNKNKSYSYKSNSFKQPTYSYSNYGKDKSSYSSKVPSFKPYSYEMNSSINQFDRPEEQKIGVTYYHPKSKPSSIRWEDSLRGYYGDDMRDVQKRKELRRRRRAEELNRKLYYVYIINNIET